MKKLLALCLLSVTLTLYVSAQPSPAETESQGQVTLADNSVQSGQVKDNIRKKGEVVIIANGKKNRYKAGDITAVKIGNTQYITRNHTFYELVWHGTNLCLLRKASEPSGIQYNGTEAIAVNSEGKIDDFFIKTNNGNALHWINKKNADNVIKSVNSNCTAALNAGNLSQAGIIAVLETCDKQ